MVKEPVELGTVQETLLIPLYGRARDARSRNPVLGDQKAVELVERIDYDFSTFTGPSLAGSVLRTAIFDGWVSRFLREHPAGTVVELGSGLNTRSDRLDNGRARWFDLDLPDSIALRRKFFDDTDRATMIAGSVLDVDWFDQVADAPGPYLFVSEAVLLYLPEHEVRTAVRQLGERFPGSWLSFDTGGRAMMGNQDRNPVFKTLSARMRWVCDDPASIEAWGLRLLDSRTFATPQPEVARGWPHRFRYGMPLLARLAPPLVNTYAMNLYTLR
ncbi:class I SAM-dependent methyltransferase [Pseudonocardia endophytica]|uniref:O-methyltransferase involved in polyketide biosynthesis n=1 Tax=Pseudonocardia endophytica TaxID=401976 RepID=A0A4R1HM54_PSEEN|nr:class I SAM-dependent methyltransferase [Pseudonocardia endophytica]TCK22113.1 O-methyltransferase involved in polyketide biosynthesis [Pseudonocardia endophytica]